MTVYDLIVNLPQKHVLYVYDINKIYRGTQLEDFTEILNYPVNVVSGLQYGYILENTEVCYSL